MRKSGFWTVLFAFIPGAGQMYQGYMKRGLSMGLLVVLPFALAMFIGMDALIFPCLILYMYNFFDALNLRSQLLLGTAPADDFMLHWGGDDLGRLFSTRHHLVGWALVLVGVFTLYNNFLSPWLWNFIQMAFGYDSVVYIVVSNLLHSLPNLVVAIALIGVGMWLVKGNRKTAAPVDDFTEFKGSSEE